MLNDINMWQGYIPGDRRPHGAVELEVEHIKCNFYLFDNPRQAFRLLITIILLRSAAHPFVAAHLANAENLSRPTSRRSPSHDNVARAASRARSTTQDADGGHEGASTPYSSSDTQDFAPAPQVELGGSWVQQPTRGRRQNRLNNEVSSSRVRQNLPSSYTNWVASVTPSFGQFLHPKPPPSPLQPHPNPNQGIERSATSRQETRSNANTPESRSRGHSTDTRGTSRSESSRLPRPPASRGNSPGHASDNRSARSNSPQAPASGGNSPQLLSLRYASPSASTSSNRSINPIMGGFLGLSSPSIRTSHSASVSNIASYPSFYSHHVNNYQVLPHPGHPPSMDFATHVGLNHLPDLCWVSFLGECIMSHCCNRRFHLRRHLPTGSPAFLLPEEDSQMGQENLRDARRGVAMMKPATSFVALDGERGAITLEAFHPGTDPVSGWVQYLKAASAGGRAAERFSERLQYSSSTSYAALQSASTPSSSSSSSSASSTVSSTFSARISPANYFHNTTPATSATSSPALSEADLSRPKDTSTREGNKTKYPLNLVDQSVKSLCDIWRPQDIPANSKATLAPSNPSLPTTPVLIQTGTTEAPAPLVPVRGFVHEVLKRSRTSGGVLQTALCYLEAIRPKLAELIRQEKEGTGMRISRQASAKGRRREASIRHIAFTVFPHRLASLPSFQPHFPYSYRHSASSGLHQRPTNTFYQPSSVGGAKFCQTICPDALPNFQSSTLCTAPLFSPPNSALKHIVDRARMTARNGTNRKYYAWPSCQPQGSRERSGQVWPSLGGWSSNQNVTEQPQSLHTLGDRAVPSIFDYGVEKGQQGDGRPI
ncbi:hypothetical protein BKA70DRAFT_1528649 [Coprinopsis sp. MPI-PUGE-AT-0042]|nr:hypothetical protein BKA70DRAFT_1528649 [Coprinopsis sp. MPI-PUGE-AT-0042]